ncbi:MAG: FAD-dependent oxidoreductase [Sulfuritalea sp.]|jgi:indolepyruvate ferredoxin oxidoreductase alpha subunit|nr:FAD-dependent oxidoreductase [Sulfuritalea sp.]
MDMKTTDHRVLLGNEAISRGLVEAGCQFMTAYPGTPSSEILPAVIEFKKELGLNLYAEWSTNEKVALETALAAAYAGKRTAVAMKQVGLNVAADPALSAAYIGVVGGLVLIVADDPGLHSSQTEQDSRLFALFSKIPALDPSSPQEAKDMVAQAFALSERHQLPVMLRPTVRVCHSEQSIECKPVDAPFREADFEKNPRRWAATPRARMALHQQLNQKLAAIEKEFETWPGNHAFFPTGSTTQRAPLGIVAAGVSYAYLNDMLHSLGLADQLPVLKIATVYPLPRALVENFASRCERLIVFEETDAAVELQIRLSIPVWGRLTGHIPSHGELTPGVIEKLLVAATREAGLVPTERAANRMQDAVAGLELPIRRPTFCPGCGHRSVFYSLRRAFPEAIFPGDIGCYTLGLNQGSVDTVHDMGASISMASGFYHAYAQDGKTPPIFATIGDGTFFHSGAAGLENAIYNGARFVLLVLDNGTTGMTGMQPTPEFGKTADGHAGGIVNLETLIRGCGISYLEHADPHDLATFQRVLLDALDHTRAEDGGVAVVLARYACVTQMKGLGPNRTAVPVEVHHGTRPRAPDAVSALDAPWMPRHQDRLSPCAEACPAGNDVERLMTLAAADNWTEAARTLYAEHPFPSTLGRVCPHPCESKCNRNAYDGALSINAIERMAGDRGHSAATFATRGQTLGKTVAVVGGGPSGLAAAYHLARIGYGVEIYEALPEIGGMLRWAITEYRLPADVLERELEVFESLGITLHTGIRLGKDMAWSELDRFDAVYLATGAWKQRQLKIAGEDRAGVLSGLDYLYQVRAGQAPELGAHVAIVGGGNTAIDAARTARRKGAAVDVYYDVLLAIPEEVTAARDEGIVLHHAVVPVRFAAGETSRLKLYLRDLAVPQAGAGRDAPVFSTETSEADSVLICIGGDADLTYLSESDLAVNGRLAVDAWGRTGQPRIFAGGDASSAGAGTVVGAINAGKRAALAIHERLGGKAFDAAALQLGAGPGIATSIASSAAGSMMANSSPRARQQQSAPDATAIKLQFFRKKPRAESRHRAPNDSIWNFDEVNFGLGSAEATAEAGERCFHCGVCTHCDICVNVCPTEAITQVDGAYRIDQSKCTACRICAAECPRSAITMPQTGVCIACGYCTTWFECPSLKKGADGLVDIDRRTCIDCGMCIQVCAQGAIRPRQAQQMEVRT